MTGLSSLNGSDASENETSRFVKYREQDLVQVPRPGHRPGDPLLDRRQGNRRSSTTGRKVGTRIETRANQPLGFATWESAGALRNIEIRPLTPAEIEAANKPDE